MKNVIILPSIHNLKIWPTLMNKILSDLVHSLSKHNVFILLINPPPNINEYFQQYENTKIIIKQVKYGDFTAIKTHLEALIDEYDIDIATNVLGGGQYVGQIIVDACKGRRTNTVLRVSGSEIDAKIFIHGNAYKYSEDYFKDSAIQLSNFQSCDKILVMSQAEKKRITSFVDDADKILIAPRGIDTDYFDCDLPDFFTGKRNRMNVLYLGRDSREKGSDIAFDIVKKSNQLDLNTVYNFAGNFSDKTMETYQDQRNLNFLGYLSSDEIKRAIAENDVMILPSRLDALPQSLLECMASKRICIVPEHLFSDFIDHGKNGLVCKLDASFFLSAIRDLLENPDRGIKICNAARSFIKTNFYSRTCSQNYEKAVTGDVIENS